METIERILTILQIISGVVVMILVLLQSDKEGSGNIVTGPQERSSGAGMSGEARLVRLTTYAGIIFAILTVASSSIMLLNR